MQRGIQQLSHMQSLLCFLTSLLQKDQLSSSKRNHDSAGSGVVQTSTCSGVIFSKPWNSQYPDWVSRSSGQIASCFSSWPNSFRKIKMFPGKPECILAQSDLLWSRLCSSNCFTPLTGQPGRLRIKRIDYSCLRSCKFLCILSL